ncbi:hypothetical protein ACTWP5_05680 [Streptomyces sp. 4N509B]|uniref:hypothetical protein n=1 Tax=Streptomyces sp. 4N509B TaxID=3457413 RepID=UPI003FD01789
METVLIIAVAVVVIAAALLFAPGWGAARGGERLRRRFGSEYHRAVAQQEGDTKAAERELRERVRRHGSLRERPLSPGDRELYETRWAEIHRRFVDSPQEATAETEALLARVAQERGYPAGPFEERVAAISVHHGDQVHSYRRLHAAVTERPDTEELRQSMIEARGLFEALTADRPTASTGGRAHVPWASSRRFAKGGGTS